MDPTEFVPMQMDWTSLDRMHTFCRDVGPKQILKSLHPIPMGDPSGPHIPMCTEPQCTIYRLGPSCSPSCGPI